MGELGRIAGVSVPAFLDPDSWRKLGQEIETGATMIGAFDRMGDEGAVKVFGNTVWLPGKEEEFRRNLIKNSGLKGKERLAAEDALSKTNDPEKMRKSLTGWMEIKSETKTAEKAAKAEAEAIDQKQFSRQTGLMDRSFGYQKQLEALNAANNLRLEDKRGQYGLANQRLANEGSYRVNDLTSRRSLEGTKYSADAQVRASRLNALAGMLTPRETAFRGTGMKGLE